MKPSAFAYHAPRSLEEAVARLAELGGDGKVLAGGQSLVPMMNMRLVAPAALVDLAHLDGLDHVEVADDAVQVDARVTHEQLRRHPAAAAAQPLLRQALDHVAHTVVRNRGTVVGSVVHADPAAELPAVLALLDGEVELVSAAGARTVRAADYLLGPLESDTRPGELAIRVRFPVLPQGTGTAFEELARRHGDYAMAGVGVTVALDEDRRVAGARAGFLGVGVVPIVVELGGVLAGQPHDALRSSEAVALARDAIDPADDIHATADYRRHLAGALLARAMEVAARAAAQRRAPR